MWWWTCHWTPEIFPTVSSSATCYSPLLGRNTAIVGPLLLIRPGRTRLISQLSSWRPFSYPAPGDTLGWGLAPCYGTEDSLVLGHVINRKHPNSIVGFPYNHHTFTRSWPWSLQSKGCYKFEWILCNYVRLHRAGEQKIVTEDQQWVNTLKLSPHTYTIHLLFSYLAVVLQWSVYFQSLSCIVIFNPELYTWAAEVINNVF